MASRSSWGKARKLKSGKYQASHLNPVGKRVNAPETFQTKKMAQLWLAEQQTLMAQGKWAPTQQIRVDLFKDFAERHIELQTSSKGKSLHGSTKALYKRLLNNDLTNFHALEVQSITSKHVEEWWLEKSSSGKLTTASKAYKLLHATLNRALADGLISTNPCRIRGAHTAVTGKELYLPSVQELGSLATSIAPELKAAIILASYGGLRFGEWTALTREDVELISTSEGAFFRIHVTKAYSKIGASVVLGETKSKNGVRSIDLSSQLTPIVAEHLLSFAGPSNTGLLFQKKLGQPITHDYFIKRFNKAASNAGISQLTPHALRHFGATEKVRLGINFADLRKWLGDSTNQAALGYVHAAQNHDSHYREMPVAESLLASRER
jgi:integrase